MSSWQTISVALCGAGRIGAVHATNVAAHACGRLRYVVDVDSATAATFAGKYGAEAVALETALSDPELDAVVIATPTPAHVDIAVAAARAGKAIFCEKPIDLSSARVDACLREVERCKVSFAVGFQRRFDPTFRALRQTVREGRIGEVELIRVTSRDPHPPPPGYVEASGGLFRDMMIHDFDIVCWILEEEPVEVFATGSSLVDPHIARLGDVDTAVAVLRTASGKICHIENSRRAVYGYDQRVEVLGSKGQLVAGNRSPTAMELWTAEGLVRDRPFHFFIERYAEAYAAEMDHFLTATAAGTEPEVGGEAGRRSLRLADAAQRSHDGKEVVKLSPERA